MVPANTSPLPVLGDSFFPRRPTIVKYLYPQARQKAGHKGHPDRVPLTSSKLYAALACALFSAFPSTRYLGSTVAGVYHKFPRHLLLSSPFANLVKHQYATQPPFCNITNHARASLRSSQPSPSRLWIAKEYLQILQRTVGLRLVYGSSGPGSRRRLSWVRKGP